MRPVIPNKLRIDRVLKLVDEMGPEERTKLFEELDVVMRSIVDRAFALVEKMTDDDRAELFELLEAYCELCGQPMPEDQEEHDCPCAPDEDEDDELEDDELEDDELEDDELEDADYDDEDEEDEYEEEPTADSRQKGVRRQTSGVSPDESEPTADSRRPTEEEDES
jgi:hypothetical protein